MKVNQEAVDKFHDYLVDEFFQKYPNSAKAISVYLEHLLEVIRLGGIFQISVGGKTYEVHADILETEI